MISETNVKCFLSLANTLNFTKTASELYLTQQAVSKNISKMEDSIGFPLFERSHHEVALTPAGERIYTLFSKFSVEYDEALQELHSSYGGDCQSIRIGYQNWLDFGTFPGLALAAMREIHPNLFLVGERHSPVVLTDLLKRQKTDLIILYQRFAPDIPGFQKKLLFKSPSILMVSVDHPLATADATYETFVEEPFIFDSFENEKTAETHERAVRDAARCGLRPRQIVVMPNRDSAYTAAELGRGVILTSELTRITKSSVLKTYPMDTEEEIVAIWRDSPRHPLVDEYVEYLTREYESWQ